MLNQAEQHQPVSSIDASVIICTYNRGDSLRDTLNAILALKPPSCLVWEILVVDNNSPDHTRSVVEEAQRNCPDSPHSTGHPKLRYEFESKQGLSHARNHGITYARGEVLLFTDDDVLPEPDWLQTTLEGLKHHQADACGGYIAPIWEVPPPDWLTERFYGFLAVRTDREDDYPITSPSQAPFGANMAFRRQVFDRVGLFDTSRGRKGKVLASGEDGEMFERILAAGLKAVFLGQSRVHHKVESFRTTKTYLRRWRTQSSRNLAVSRGLPGERRIANIPLYLFPQFLRALVRAALGKLFQPKDEAFNREMIVCHFIGTFQGLWATRNASQDPRS